MKVCGERIEVVREINKYKLPSIENKEKMYLKEENGSQGKDCF